MQSNLKLMLFTTPVKTIVKSRILQIGNTFTGTNDALTGRGAMNTGYNKMFSDLTDFHSLQDFETMAMTRLDHETCCYFSATAGKNKTLRTNEGAFEKIKIVPRVFRDTSSMDLTLTMLGSKVSSPVGISPVAFQQLAHPTAELGIAKATSEEDAIAVIGCGSSIPLEELADKCPSGVKWFQLYLFNDRELTKNLIEKVEACAQYSALVLTFDSPVIGLWHKDVPSSFFSKVKQRLSNVPRNLRYLLDPSVTFRDLLWLKSITKLPIVAKGIMTGEDAILSIQHGASAIFVSNHGGRMIDGVSATVDVLEEVVCAVRKVNSEVEVYLDGGVRSGSDVFKALALGARAVFVGRPAIWGLTVAGKDGVRKVLSILKSDLKTIMSLSGARSLKDISREMVRRENYCSRCKL